ncbi:para-nitrobenzyl esterase isoform X1 [Diabrotica virgifera virgifera]|uniref:Carboxylic ester hydrolase n=1 Tax=Diabrotica virgifera virgifera TaxID=50390 RepID=A0ABM5IUS1_DIAVI|nr:para-nitrobenzyl esterase isoform X1 [Diabrotica virgifera virgifera]
MAHLKLFIHCVLIFFVHEGLTSPVAESTDDDLIVTLSTGSKVRGHVLQSFEGNDFQAFENIPYAEPPTGKNRFQPAIPKTPWEGVFNATFAYKFCPQFGVVAAVEDCLVLNVYKPVNANDQQLLPVFFWIHGGSFINGAGSLYDPKLLIDYDIVIVTINYRLGALGFLTTLDDNIPGNLGLKDQLLALQWVHDNINAFGGDPKQVTVGGESAGSMSAGFHLLSRLAHGLYSGIIQQSGSPLSSAFYPNKNREQAFEFGRKLNSSFASSKSSDLLKLLQEAPLSDIVTQQALSPTACIPTMEEEFNDKAFVSGPMHRAILNGEFNFVPVLIGINSEEFLLFVDADSDDFKEKCKYFDDNPEQMVSASFNVAEEIREYVGKALKTLYTNSSFVEDPLGYIKYNSDEVFGRSTARQAEAASRFVPVYMYQFSWYDKSSPLPGVKHAADLYYMWNVSFGTTTHNDALRKPILKWWTNFIKYQNPTPVKDEDLQNVIWPEVKPGSVKYLDIDSTFEVKENPRQYYQIESILDPVINEPLITY